MDISHFRLSKINIPNSTSEIASLINENLEYHLNISNSDVVYVKPNLVLPWYSPGVCTSRLVLDSLCSVLHDSCCRIKICEGDGGLASNSAEKAFYGNNLSFLKDKYNAEFVSLSKIPRKRTTTLVSGKEIQFELPQVLVDREYDAFINVPVLKVHVITGVSLSMKNLWGCIPDPFRIHYHHFLDLGIVALWKIIQPDLSIIDGLYALDKHGPLNGNAVRLNCLLAGSGDATVDRIGTQILGIPFESINHLKIAENEGLIQSRDNISMVMDVSEFCRHTFSIKRKIGDLPGIFIGRFPRIQAFVYHSKATKAIYWLLRKMRCDNDINRMPKYGEPGWGKGCGSSQFCEIPGTET